MTALLPLQDQKILLGITGGIAAYKGAELTRSLRTAGAEVRVVMTKAATAFITPLCLQALSGHPVHSDLLDPAEEAAMGHISLARWADLILIAPATADFLAKLRGGFADDLLSALCLAAQVPIAVAPAMNQAMWANPATAENVQCLRSRGFHLLGPAAGEQACGEIGLGRMLEPAELVEKIIPLLQTGNLQGLSILISAGPTREPIDPVRYLSNRSSGKMGYALAKAAQEQGASVTLVSGPVNLTVPAGVSVSRVETAKQMYEAVLQNAVSHNIYIGTAAVADYTPASISAEKIKKSAEGLELQLSKTRDILAAVAALPEPERPFTVGFAAETAQLESYAKAKLIQKNLDMVAANLVGQPTGGFDSEENALEVYWPDGQCSFTMANKNQIAHQLLDLIADHYREKNSI